MSECKRERIQPKAQSVGWVTCAVRSLGWTWERRSLEKTRLFSLYSRRVLASVGERSFFLDDVQSVEHEDVMVVFGQCHHKTFRCYLESTAAWDFDVRALKLREQKTSAGEYSYMEAISMRISNKNVTSIRYVNAVGEISNRFTPDSTDVFSFFIKYHHTVTLFKMQY